MRISGGNFDAISNAVKNNDETVLYITGGEFTSQNAFALDNSGYATVTGGELTSVNNSAIRFQIDSTKDNESSLKINGATLNSKEGISDLTIYDNALDEDVTNDYNVNLDDQGNVVIEEKQEDVTTGVVTTTTQAVEENPNTADNIGLYAILALVGLGVVGITTKSLIKHH